MRASAKAPSAETSTHGNGNAFSLGVVAAMLVCAAAFLGIGAPAASAAPEAQPGYGYLTTFGAGELSSFATLPPNPLALDADDNIFAVSENFGAVPVFAPDASAGGTRLTTVEPPGYLPRDAAIDKSNGALYLQDPGTFDGFLSIRRYLSDGKTPPGYTVDPTFEVPSGAGIAVDQTSHDLLVADPGAEGIRRYESDGTQLTTIATAGIQPNWLAIAPDGSIYTAATGGTTVFHLSSTGTVLNEVQGVGTIESLTVDPNTSRLLVAADGRLDLYSAAGTFLSETATPEGIALGLAIGSNGRVYEYSAPGGTAINTYVPAIWPGIETPVVSEIEPHSVHFSAEVDPGAGPPDESEAHFEWSDDGGETWNSTPEQALTGPKTIEADLTDITVNFDFLVRVTASNSLTSHTTPPVAFSTPETAPEVVPGAATDVTETSAVLNGTINPAGNQTTYHFEYGLTTEYGSRVPAGIEAVAGAERKNRPFKRTLTGLEPDTTYHYRLVAENSIGVTYGSDVTFTTIAVGGIPHRAYEQVTPASKNGNPVDPIFGFMARADGNAFNYGTRSGVQSSPLNSRAVSFRETDDWRGGIDIDPPMNVYPENTVFATTLGVAPDFSRAFVTSNRKLTPEAVEGGTNLYVEDIATKTYTFVGSNEGSVAMQFFAGIGNGGKFLTGADDFSWIVFYSLFPVLPDAPFFAQYKWSETDGLEVISVLPGPSETKASVNAPTYYEKTSRHASEDGSRVYFVSQEPEPGIYLREDGESRAISVSHIDGDSTTPQPGAFWGASDDGRYAFFAVNPAVPLTDDAPAKSGDVYRYDAEEDSLEYLGTNAYNGSYYDTLRSGYGVSDDGSTVYFRGGAGTPFEPNGMWVWREGELTKFSDNGDLQHIATWVSHNGRFIAFPENDDLQRYDADTEEKSCVSCMPDGTHGGGFFPGGGERITGNGVPNVITDDGKVFFTSAVRLVARDVNGMEDVYVFENGRNSLVSPGNAPFPAIFADISENGNDAFFSTSQKLVGRDNDGTVDIYDARVDGGLPKQSPPPPQECLRDDCKGTPNAGPELPFGGSEALAGPENVKPKPRKKCGKGKRAKKVKGKVRCVKKHRANKAGKGGNR